MKSIVPFIRAAVLVAALFISANTVSAYYDPGMQRWLNRDPLGDKGNLVFALEKMQPMEGNKFFIMAQVLNISVDEFTKVNANVYGFDANDPLTKVDPLGLDWLDCMAKCIQKNDPLNNLGCMHGLIPKGLLGLLGGTFPARWLPWTKLGTPLSTVPSATSQFLGMGPGNWLRGVGRFFSPFMVGYGLGMAGIEVACAAQCASDPNSFNW